MRACAGIVLLSALLAVATTVQAALTMTVNGSSTPISVPLGATVMVGVHNGPGTPQDCLTLNPVDTLGSAHLGFVWVTGTQGTFSFTMPNDSGTYAFRFWGKCGEVLLISSPVTVGGVISPPPPPPVPPPQPPPPPPVPMPVVTPSLTGQSVTVTVSGGPGGKLDWMGLFLVGASDTAYIDWARLNGTKTAPVTGLTTGKATFAIPLTGGPWEIRFLTSDGAGKYTRVAVITTIERIP